MLRLIIYTGKGGTSLGKLTDYTKFNEKQLLTALRDPNLTVRLTATHLLAEREPAAVAGPAAALPGPAATARRGTTR